MDIWVIAFIVLVVLAAAAGAALVVTTFSIRAVEQQGPAVVDQSDPDALTPPHGIPLVRASATDGARHRAPESPGVESSQVMPAAVPQQRVAERSPAHAAGR